MVATQVKELDARDWLILIKRQDKRNSMHGMIVGDVVIFNDGTQRRISYIWPSGVQTSDGGSFYLSSAGYMSYSGGLHGITPLDSLTLTGKADRSAWIFHHDVHQAHNGIDVKVTVNVWTASTPAT
jgi:hypothetical protein